MSALKPTNCLIVQSASHDLLSRRRIECCTQNVSYFRAVRAVTSPGSPANLESRRPAVCHLWQSDSTAAVGTERSSSLELVSGTMNPNTDFKLAVLVYTRPHSTVPIGLSTCHDGGTSTSQVVHQTSRHVQCRGHRHRSVTETSRQLDHTRLWNNLAAS